MKLKLKNENYSKVQRTFHIQRRCIGCGYGFSGRYTFFIEKDLVPEYFTCLMCGTKNPVGDKPLREIVK